MPVFIILVSIALQPGNEYLEDYQKNRILAFINPEEYSSLEAYQQLNSVTAIASGMLDGKGYNNNEYEITGQYIHLEIDGKATIGIFDKAFCILCLVGLTSISLQKI